MSKIHIVTFKEQEKDQKKNKAKVDIHLAKRTARGKKVKLKHEFENIPRVFIVEDADDETLEELRNDPYVLAVEENSSYELHMAQVTEWSHGVNFIDISQFRSRGWTGAGVKVGIIDTGCANHEDLTWTARYNAYTAVYGGTTPAEADRKNHGTCVAGIIAGRDNSKGYVGIAPDVQLYGVKADNEAGSGIDQTAIIDGINWLINQGVKVINCSFGSDMDHSGVRAAFQNAYEKGAVIVCSAGNGRIVNVTNNSVGYPGAYDFVIAVSALKANKQPAPYSSRGPQVNVAAPADPVMTTTASAANKAGTDYLSPSSSYTAFAGTSCAAPHVSGLAALYRQMFPDSSPDDIISFIEMFVEELGAPGKDYDFGYGMVTSPWTTHADYPGKLTSTAIEMSGNSISSSLTNGLGKFFKFVPSKTGRYFITTTSALNLYARVYDASYRQIAQDDDGGGNSQPRMTVDLEMGKTYYIMVCGYSGSQTGSFTINVVAGGAVITEDFEDTTFTIPFTGDWERSMILRAYRSKAIGHGMTSQTSFKANVPSGRTAVLSFYYYTSTEANYDKLIVTVNGATVLEKSGSNALTRFETTLNAGVNTILFKFVRNGSGDGGGNFVYIDDVELTGDGVTVSAG
ncbi:S8 family serine peptidase [Brevibacillus sp. NRS-1366]|uniref:S8 family serine peptidase n=1 Tax=Brevibacillus sp. NRS-1366 TaxID=3233899 RepID=UPI003D1D86DB